jgi:hypothetical protein
MGNGETPCHLESNYKDCVILKMRYTDYYYLTRE